MKKVLAVLLIALNVFPWIATAHEEEEFDASCDIYDVRAFEKEGSNFELMGLEDDTLEKFEKKMIDAWQNMDSSVTLYPDVEIKVNDLNTYFATVLYENPEYYYVNRSYSYTKRNGYVVSLSKITYTENDMDDVRQTWEEVRKATDEILLLITGDMTDVEKIFAVHDYLVFNYVYDITDMDQTYMIFLKKSGVCAAYSEAFQHMMNILGINCTLVSSDEMQHIWNMVEVDGKWYHIDVTWDDPVYDRFAIAYHDHILLSADAMSEMDHYGFAPYYSATDTTYDNALWRQSTGGVCSVGGVMYYINGNNLIDESGNVIFKNLDGGDGKWLVGGGGYFSSGMYSGLCKVNGVLYFNTDEAICSYDPSSGKTEIVLEKVGICGLYADKNKVIYNQYDRQTGRFVKDGEIKVCDMIVNEPFVEEGEVKVRLFNDGEKALWVIRDGDYKVEKVEKGDLFNLEQSIDEGAVYIWTENMAPLTKKFEIK